VSVHPFDRPLRAVVGATTANKLSKKLDIHTVGELLQHYPRRYMRRGELTDLAALVNGEDVTIMAEVISVATRDMRYRKGTVTEVVVTDGTGHLTLTFFNQKWPSRLTVGTRGLFAGKVSRFNKKLQLTHPEYIPLASLEDRDAEHVAGELIPVYPASEKLTTDKIGKAVLSALPLVDEVVDPLPLALRKRRKLLSLADAYRGIHRPTDWAEVYRAQRRLRFDEAFVLQVVIAQRRRAIAELAATPRPEHPDGLQAAFDASLPFTLTAGQLEVAQEIADDLSRQTPMHRLLQGEVGSGKTVVALRAMLTVVDNGGQAALLAPTEVLAMQHLRSITAMLGVRADAGLLGASDDATRVVLLTGSQSASSRADALYAASSGAAGIVVGTHALLQEHVEFHDLGLVVVDEQHRFGVEQRDALRAKAQRPPHLLVMTATPIPRTVAMTVFGDLDVSTLRELPAGRADITSHVVPTEEKPHYLDRAWQRVREEVAQGRQAYVVAPRIGSGDEAATDGEAGSAEPASVLRVVDDLREGPLRGLRLAMLHGRLPSDVKDDVMTRFASGELDVLVSTTVIEVGVDVPNASVMVVLDAERFGVSQLHQLRGRVGRGNAPGLCLLVTQTPEGSPARERLEHVAKTTDGFELAQLDLEQRREGDVLGTAQAGGRSSLRLLRAIADADLIEQAREAAIALVDEDPELTSHDHEAVRLAVDRLLSEDRAEYLDKT